MLAIQEYIKKHGIDKTISDFSLICKEYNHKILLKYNQLVSPTLMALPEMQDCRGLILEKGTWNVLSLGFRKFFNFGESNASNIDLNTAKCFIKEDGTFIQCYFDYIIGEWCYGTTGTANGEGNVNISMVTFSELFLSVVGYDFKDKLNFDLIYMFELCTPQNIVVTPHIESKVVLLGARYQSDLKELNFNQLELVSSVIGVPLVECVNISLNSLDEIKLRFENMPFYSEGYVILDDKFNRVKMKNPAYVAAHFLKSKSGSHHIMEIIKQNEIEEFTSTFPNKKEEVNTLVNKYNFLITNLEQHCEYFLNFIKVNKEYTQKQYAEHVFFYSKIHNLNDFTNLFFGLKNGKIIDSLDYLNTLDNKRLFNLLN